MDDQTFDRWTRSLARGASRRRFVAGWAAGAVALLAGRRGSAQETPIAITPRHTFCGGFAGLPCPDGYACVDLRGDSCDPMLGGRDCMGICTPLEVTNPCAAITCQEGSICCPQCGGRCVGPEVDCASLTCDGEPCGPVTCAAGEYCCNESCAICAPIGGFCTQQACGPQPYPGEGVPCDGVTCPVGEVCCNTGCGICTRPDGPCPAIICP